MKQPNLLIANLIILLITFRTVILSHIPQFYGDETLSSYLRSVCAEWSYILIVGHVLPWPVGNLSHVLMERLTSINCRVEYHDSIDLTTLTLRLNFRWVAMFDLTGIREESTYRQVITNLAQLYAKCLYCLPFILFLRPTLAQIESWTPQAPKAIPSTQHFQAILVSLESRKLDKRNCVAHLNPIINGCHRHTGLFIPQTPKHFEMLKSPVDRCDLNWTTLAIAVNQSPPICDFEPNDSGNLVARSSMDLDILHFVMNKYHFRAHYHDCGNNWGRFIQGRWTGSVAMLVNKTADLAVCSLSQTYHRSRYIDFSVPFYVAGLTFISQTPSHKSRQWILVQPFSWLIWILLVASYLFLFFSLMLNYLYHNDSMTNSKSGVNFVAMRLYAILVNQSGNMDWQERSVIRILYATWLLSSMILTTLYSGYFYSLLSLPSVATPIDTIENFIQAIDHNDYKVASVEGYSYMDLFNQATPDDFTMYLIGQKFNKSSTSAKFRNSKQGFEALSQDPRLLLLLDRPTQTYLRDRIAKVPMHIGSEPLTFDYFSWGYPRHSPLRAAFNVVLNRLLRFGLVEYITDQVFHSQNYRKTTTKVTESEQIRPLTVLDLATVFWLLLLGIATATVAFVIERLQIWLTGGDFHHHTSYTPQRLVSR